MSNNDLDAMPEYPEFFVSVNEGVGRGVVYKDDYDTIRALCLANIEARRAEKANGDILALIVSQKLAQIKSAEAALESAEARAREMFERTRERCKEGALRLIRAWDDAALEDAMLDMFRALQPEATDSTDQGDGNEQS